MWCCGYKVYKIRTYANRVEKDWKFGMETTYKHVQ